MFTSINAVLVFWTLLATSVLKANAIADINNPLGATCAALNAKANTCLEQATNPGNMATSHALACVVCANVFLEDLDDQDLANTTCSETQDDACHVVEDCRCGACADEVADYLNCELKAMWETSNGQECELECSAGILSHGISIVTAAAAVASAVIVVFM